MALLSGMARTVAITGSTDAINGWVGGSQGGRWAERTVRAAYPTAVSHAEPSVAASPAQADPAEALRTLTDLHERGVVTDAEFERLRAGL